MVVEFDSYVDDVYCHSRRGSHRAVMRQLGLGVTLLSIVGESMFLLLLLLS